MSKSTRTSAESWGYFLPYATLFPSRSMCLRCLKSQVKFLSYGKMMGRWWQNPPESLHKKLQSSQAWWCAPVMLALRRKRQDDRCEFKASLGYEVNTRPA